MKKVLIVDDSNLFREYLANKLRENNFNVIEARNGLEGGVKLRNEMPDLVIMEYYLPRKSSIELLQEKKANPNVCDVPVIMVSTRIDRKKILTVASYNVKKFFSKPIKLDALLQTISAFLQVKVEIDRSPCIIEAHFNDDILFIEIAMGLNTEKIELLKYKITELMQLYGVVTPKILMMMSNIELDSGHSSKLELLFNSVIEKSGAHPRHIKVLASSPYLREFVRANPDYRGIAVVDSLDKAMDDLLGLRPDSIAHDEIARERILQKSEPVMDSEEHIELRFEAEKAGVASEERKIMYPDARVAVVDDDMVIRELVRTVLEETGWELQLYSDGREFVDALEAKEHFDLVFLDLMMPEMNGFQVLQYMKQTAASVPTIVFSALTRKETVGKAMSYGVKSYLIKPLKPENLRKKAIEVLVSDF